MVISLEGIQNSLSAWGNAISSKTGNLSGYLIYPLEQGGKFIESYSQNRAAAVTVLIAMCFAIKQISKLITDYISSFIPKTGDLDTRLRNYVGSVLFLGGYYAGVQQGTKYIKLPLSNGAVFAISLLVLGSHHLLQKPQKRQTN